MKTWTYSVQQLQPHPQQHLYPELVLALNGTLAHMAKVLGNNTTNEGVQKRYQQLHYALNEALVQAAVRELQEVGHEDVVFDCDAHAAGGTSDS